MKAIKILEARSNNASDDVKIDLKLYNLAHDLEKKSRSHLKRIITVLSEFDIHDEKHSEKVIENIELLLGNDTLSSLSSYELFLLHLSAYFHDCAMAPSDWEINTMKLTEGSEKFFNTGHSIKHDLKTPLKSSSAIKIISENKRHLYKSFDSDVKNWVFSQSNENDLINYLASLLIEYQNYRNGFSDQLKSIENIDEFNNLNEFIRIDYIRATHHTRIEPYIKNLEPIFSNAFEQPAWGKKLAHDLALICRSHGEDAIFISPFSTNAQYFGSNSANLQFIAVMLRLGDVIHFSYDRAPIDLRSSRLFKSEYSFQQWAIKNSGVNYSIDNGQISFRAYCESPETYFKLHEYLDWIEIEIQHYFKFQRQWEKLYISNLQDKINRTNIINDENSFLPKRGLHFSLNQKKILELLMGVGLYKDKFACLRELYQNSLDACRCMISLNEALQISSEAIIEFSIIKEDNNTYLYCIDNGIGMTREIIETYLLKIGNSYYKSSDFYKQQANWGSKFTPTSQFGIGILSCFMIGDKIEITTKSRNSDYISCSIDGPHENFYYKKTTDLDKEKIDNSGTIIKIHLNDNNSLLLNNTKLFKLGLLLLGIEDRLPDEFSEYLSYSKNWENHLYNKINHFVQLIPEKTKVLVEIEDGSKMQLLSKPVLIDIGNKLLEIEEEDSVFIDYLNNHRRFYSTSYSYRDIKEFIRGYEIRIKSRNIEYITNIFLPTKEFNFDRTSSLYYIPIVGGNGICIDGIRVDKNDLIAINSEKYYSEALSSNGFVNFFGELRPQLSVDRTSIINYPDEAEKEAKEICTKLLKEIIELVKKHIELFNFSIDSNEFNLIWEYVFIKIGFAENLFVNELSLTNYGDIKLTALNSVTNSDLSIRDFLSTEEITIKDFKLSKLNTLVEKLILVKMMSAQKIEVNEDSVSIHTQDLSIVNLRKDRRRDSDYALLIAADHWNVFDSNYDIISALYPLIPRRLFNLFEEGRLKKISERIVVTYSYSNGITAFFKQNPLLINEKLGLYMAETDSFVRNRDKIIYNFDKKRPLIRLFEINDSYFDEKDKERYVLVVYISPIDLSPSDLEELEKLENTDPMYVKGVNEGWSLLVTTMDKENIIISPGKRTREYLVSLISDDFWETYKDYTFIFTDNVIMTR